MKILEQLRGTDGFPDAYIDNLIEKARVSARRKADFNPNGYNGKRIHWANLTGRYRDEELRKGPKYWHGQKPVRTHNPIRSYQDLATAIGLIASGDKAFSDYRGVRGIDAGRLRLAQSWRDKGIYYHVSDIVRLSFFEIEEEMGFGKNGFGQVYQH